MNLALFDFDGTITTREMFPDFIRFAVAPRRIAYGRVLLAPLILGYKIGIVSGVVVRAAIIRVGFSGVPLATLETDGRNFARSVLPSVVRPAALDRINRHKSQGDTVVVVSGALDVYLHHWCSAHQIYCLCSSLAHKDGILTGRYAGPQCVSEEKARRVRKEYDLTRYRRIYAYGDTMEDLQLLALAHERYYQWRQLRI